MEPSPKLNGNDTTTLSCHFANFAHHKTLHMHISLFTATKCHQCAMHTLTTRSEIELLDTRYVASTRIHTTIHHCSISCIDSVLSGLL